MSTIKKKFKILDMHCSSCAIRIEGDLEDLSGIKKAQSSYAKALVEVEYEEELISEEVIIETVKKTGYTLEKID